MDVWVVKCMDGRMDCYVYGWIDVDRTDGIMDGCIYRWIDGLFDGWMGVGMNGWMVSI
jgi:hypothetical protein